MMIKKFRNFQAGMTYVELIVVLSIFSVMTSIVLFNYNGFQSKIDIRVLANDIALKIVEAQKAAISGKLPPKSLIPFVPYVDTWKPSYGVYFDKVNYKDNFIYFFDFNNDSFYDMAGCSGTEECQDNIFMTKGNFISGLEAVGCPPINNLSIVFKRPDSGAILKSNGLLLACASSVKITISSADTPPITSNIEVYPSGRIQINEN